MRKTHLPFSSN